MTIIQDLWTDDHERNLERFVRAVDNNDVMVVLATLELESLDELDEAIDAQIEKIRGAQLFGMTMGVAVQISSIIENEWRVELAVDADVRKECSLGYAFRTKQASPRTLAALWAYVASRAGIDAHWLEMSVFHPIVLSDDESEVMIDTTSGALVTRKDCIEIFDAVTEGEDAFDDAMFEAPTAKEIALSILELRLAAATTSNDEVAAWHAMRFHAELNRDKPGVVFAAAMAASALGEYVYAHRELTWLKGECAGTSLEEPIDKALERLNQRKLYAN